MFLQYAILSEQIIRFLLEILTIGNWIELPYKIDLFDK